MRYVSFYLLSTILTLAGLLTGSKAAIARPHSGASLSSHQLSRFSRDLHQPSPSEDFFRQGRLQLEREIQLRQTRKPATDDILRVSPDDRPLPDAVPIQKSLDRRQQRI